MIEYSKQESEIFKVQFGRLNLENNFQDWDTLKTEISKSDCEFIRLRIQNPNSKDLEMLNSLGKKAHLLEILRVYRSYDVPYENVHKDLKFEKVTNSTIHILEKILVETYDDIPFGNYTPESVLDVFPRNVQQKALSEYYNKNYNGIDKNKIGYIIYDHQENIVGCLMTEFLLDSTYTYYIGIKKEYRGKRIFFRVINFIYHLTKLNNLKFGECAARLTNAYSQRTLEKSNMEFIRYDWVFLIEK